MPVGLLQFPEIHRSLNETSSIPEPLVILASIFEKNPIKESFALLLGVCDKSKINLLLLIYVQILSYIFAVIKWFIADHFSFWHGFKDLIFTILPIVNIFYVYDWWFAIIKFIFSIMPE